MDGIKQIFMNEVGLDPALYSDELAYNSVPEWTSTSHMIIILAIEERYGIALDSDEIVAATSVQKIRELLKEKGISDGV